jgi:Tfp pilus assembly protein PilN
MTVQPQENLAPPEEQPTTSRVDWAPVPRVNLLPPEITGARAFRTVQRRLVLVVIMVIALAGAGVYWAQGRVNQAQAAVDVTTSQATALQHQQSAYAQVPILLAELDAARAARSQALGQDVLWYRFLNDVALATPANVSLTTMAVTVTDPGSATSTTAAATSDPLVPTGIGTMTVTGTAAGYPDVATWMRSIATVKGLDASTLQTATRDGASAKAGSITFTTSVVVTATALSHRYDRRAG